jgi:iron(III) transport system permease protein
LLAALLIVGVRAVESFEVPALLGIPGGIWVFTSRIWRALGEHPLDLGEAGAYAVVLLAMTTLGVVAAGRLSGRSRRFETLSGRRSAQRRIPLGRWRPAALAFVGAYVLVAVVLPVLALVYASTQPYYRALSVESLSGATFDNYAAVLTDSETLRSLGNSIVLAVGTATAVTLATAVVAWLVVRARVRGGSLLDSLVFLPIAVPGIVLGVALLAVYLRMPLPVYGTLWILLIAYFTRFMPYGMRYASSSMAQMARELEESAATCGARWWQTFRRVLLPLALPGLAAGWITVLVFSLRELSSSILLYSPGNEVLAITIWEQYENGQFPELAALGVLMVIGLVCLVTISYRLAGRAGLREV